MSKMIENVINAIAYGLINGILYGLLALGLAITFGIVKIINVSHGCLVMIGMYAAYWLYVLYGINPFLSPLIIAPLSLMMGMILQRFSIDKLKKRLRTGEYEMMVVLLMFGLAILMENSALILWKADYRALIIPSLSSPLKVGGIEISLGRLLIAITSVVIYCLISLFLKNTYLGKAIRAVIENEEAARLMGINTRVMSSIGLGIGISITVITGSFLGLLWNIYPSIGWSFLFYAFASVALGAMGSIIGSLVGGIIFGLLESICSVLWTAQVSPILSVLIFIAVLQFRPRGLFGGKE